MTVFCIYDKYRMYLFGKKHSMSFIHNVISILSAVISIFYCLHSCFSRTKLQQFSVVLSHNHFSAILVGYSFFPIVSLQISLHL